jgi:O-acetylserine/cysteine efflux transporter
VATILGFSIWARLLARYPAAMVAPFALLTPCVGLVTSALVLGERFSPRRYAGIALILAGIGVSALPVARRGTRGGREGTQEIDVRRPTPGLRLNTDD